MIFWIIIKILLISSLSLICFQDIKERKVYWFLFPLIGFLCGWLHWEMVLPEVFLLTLCYNLGFIFIISLFTFLYIKFKLQKSLKNSFGTGDFLFFVAVAFSFASFTFMIIFVLSLIFSLSLHLILKNITKDNTVPLAGYMSLFFLLTYLGYWIGIIDTLYLI